MHPCAPIRLTVRVGKQQALIRHDFAQTETISILVGVAKKKVTIYIYPKSRNNENYRLINRAITKNTTKQEETLVVNKAL